MQYTGRFGLKNHIRLKLSLSRSDQYIEEQCSVIAKK